MVISRDSWHYKLLSAYDLEYGANNLCSYVRRIMFALAVSAFLFLVVALFIYTLLLPLISWAELLEGGFFAWVFVFLLLSGGVYAMAKEVAREKKYHGFWFRKIEFQRSAKPNAKPTKQKSESEFSRLLFVYWRAFKDKVCPVVEFE